MGSGPGRLLDLLLQFAGVFVQIHQTTSVEIDGSGHSFVHLKRMQMF
jgi:hypothetical protein